MMDFWFSRNNRNIKFVYLKQVSLDECVKSLHDIRDGVNPLGKPTFLGQLTTDLVDGVFKEHKISRLKM